MGETGSKVVRQGPGGPAWVASGLADERCRHPGRVMQSPVERRFPMVSQDIELEGGWVILGAGVGCDPDPILPGGGQGSTLAWFVGLD